MDYWIWDFPYNLWCTLVFQAEVVEEEEVEGSGAQKKRDDLKNIIQDLNKAFDNRIRLGIMSILVVNEWVEFKDLKNLLELTDGNLASHITALEKAECLEFRKEFVGKRPKTSYKVTENGRKLFEKHLQALESLIRKKI